MVVASGGQEASVGAQRDAFDSTVMCALETVADGESGEREAGDRSGRLRHDQAASFSIDDEPFDVALERTSTIHCTGLEIIDDHRVAAVCHQLAIATDKGDRPDRRTRRKLSDGPIGREVTDIEIPLEVAAGKPLAEPVEGQCVGSTNGGSPVADHARPDVPDQDMVIGGTRFDTVRHERSVAAIGQGAARATLGPKPAMGGSSGRHVPGERPVTKCRELLEARV